MSTETKFIVGQEYFYRFACDWDTKSYMTVVSRTEKTAMILMRYETKPVRRKIHVWNGVESISAGNYSMAGIWSADKQDKGPEEVPAPVVEVPEVQESPSNIIPFPVKAAPKTMKPMNPSEAGIIEAMGRKILMEALESQGKKLETDLISAILDREHGRLLEILRGMAAGIRADNL